MKPKNGIKEMMVERNNVEDDRESEKSEQFILVAERQPWEESMDIIATRGFIKGTKV